MPLVFERHPQPTYDARVAFIQLLLGFSGNSADGLFGPGTETRVKQFQQNEGLPQDGRVDETTGRRLQLPYWDAPIARNDLDAPFRDSAKFPQGHQFVFEPEIGMGGHFCSKPERFIPGTLNKWSARALRTNNPGALNISSWQKSMPGYVGKTLDDGSGNSTTIYETPEKGVIAWHELIVVLYSQKQGYIQNGTFTLGRLARAYAGVGLNTPDGHPAVDGYLAGWAKWANRIPDSQLGAGPIDPTNGDQLRQLAIAMFSHEASFATPLTAAEVRRGIEMAQERIANGPHAGPASVVASIAEAGQQGVIGLAARAKKPAEAGAVDLAQAEEEERINGEKRAQRMLRILELEKAKVDLNEGLEK